MRSPIRSSVSNVLTYSGVFYPAGTGSITGESNTAGATVARTNTGKITVTFPKFFQNIYGFHAQLHLATANASKAQIDSFSKGSTSTKASMVIGTYGTQIDEGHNSAAADVAANAENKVTWTVTVRL